MKMMKNGFPRRVCLEELTHAELAISNAIAVVEELGADTRLTEAVMLLVDAKNKVADFVDDLPTLTTQPGCVE